MANDETEANTFFVDWATVTILIVELAVATKELIKQLGLDASPRVYDLNFNLPLIQVVARLYRNLSVLI